MWVIAADFWHSGEWVGEEKPRGKRKRDRKGGKEGSNLDC